MCWGKIYILTWEPQCQALWKDKDRLSFACCQHNKSILWHSWVFRYICLVTAYLFSPCILIFSFQIRVDYLVHLHLLHFTDEQTEWCLTSHSTTEADLLCPSEVHHGPLNAGFKDGRANFGGSPTFSLTLSNFLTKALNILILSWLTRYLIFKDGWRLFKNIVLTLTAQAPLQKNHDLAERLCMPNET